eukprot:COSAG01_NODE_41825_length_446_cov_14.608069_1_plen_40_part_01
MVVVVGYSAPITAHRPCDRGGQTVLAAARAPFATVRYGLA